MLHYEIKFSKIITRELVKKNPNSLFIFGDNCRRKGTGGQAVIRGMQNVAGIATKIEPNMNDNAFFSDSNYQFATNVIFTDIENIKIRLSSGEYTTVVFPLDGLGDTYNDAKRNFLKSEIYRDLIFTSHWKKFFLSKTKSWYIEPVRFIFFILSRLVNAKNIIKRM